MTVRRRAAIAAGRRPSRLLVGGLALAGATLAGGCNGGDGLSSNTVSDCVRSLPVAAAALHGDHNRLLGVHLVPADKLPARVRPAVPAEDDSKVCALAFKGVFAAGTVTDARPGVSGTIAVILVDEKRNTVVGSFVGTQLPRALRGHLI